MKKTLFVCIGNSCRSQMAEGFARSLGRGVLEAWSAGSKPLGLISPQAAAVMAERGIDISEQWSKGLGELPPGPWDYVVTMGCGDACPFVPAVAKLEWEIPDPWGKPDEEFRRVRDLIEEKVRALLADAKG